MLQIQITNAYKLHEFPGRKNKMRGWQEMDVKYGRLPGKSVSRYIYMLTHSWQVCVEHIRLCIPCTKTIVDHMFK